MKTSTVVRFVLAVLCTAFVSIDLFVTGFGNSLFLVGSYTFFLRRSDLMKPIPAISIVFAILLAGSVVVNILFFRKLANVSNAVFAAATFVVMVSAFYFEWRWAKKGLPYTPPEPAEPAPSNF